VVVARPLALHVVPFADGAGSKLDHALVIAFALAEILVQASERIGVPNLMRPSGSRNVLDRFTNAIIHDMRERASLPPSSFVPSAFAEIVVVSDLWSPTAEVLAMVSSLAVNGAHGHLVQVVDPAEDSLTRDGSSSLSRKVRARSPLAVPKHGSRNSEQRVARHRAAIRTETDRIG
jgi:hypothetical protein